MEADLSLMLTIKTSGNPKMAKSDSKRIFTSVRPARVACLIYQDDEDWQDTCLRIIEFFSSVWGGSHNIIVPTTGNEFAKVFWEVLSAYDADYIYYYYKTTEDLKNARPEGYNAWLATRLEAYLAEDPLADLEQARRQVQEIADREYLTREISPQFSLEITKRLAPFHTPGHLTHGIGSGSASQFPLAPLATILSDFGAIPNIAIPEAAYNGIYPLWLASVTGTANDKLMTTLDQLPTPKFPLPSSTFDPIEFIVNPQERAALLSNASLATLFDLTSTNLGVYRPVKGSNLRGPLIIVVGESLQDFCLYYSLARLREPVLWLPHVWLQGQLADEGGRSLFGVFAQSLKILLRDIDTNPKCVVTSQSLERDQVEALVADLGRASLFRTEDLKGITEVSFNLDGLLSWPLRVFNSGNASRPTSIIVQEDSELELFETPKPMNFSRIHPYNHRWITDVTVAGYYLPRHPALGEWAIRSPILGTSGARIGRRAFSYFCPNIGYAGGDIDSVLVRPTIFIPSPLQIFERTFWSIGYESKLSDKGFFAHETISKFGGLEAIGSFLHDPFTRQVLLKFLDSSEAGTLDDDGCLLNDQRRYLHLPSLSKILGSDKASQKNIELLMLAGILYRGCIFKCRSCRNADWFGLDEFSQTFKCKRCGATQLASSENYWYAENEPGWFYKLDEIVYQFLRHNGYVTCLALDCLRARSEESFLYTGDLELIKSGSDSRKPEFELDIAAIVDGDIVLGEAKKNNRLDTKEIKKYLHIANKVGAKKLVFATFAASWSSETEKNIANIINAANIEPIILAYANLISGQ
jgi:hypothetical protein